MTTIKVISRTQRIIVNPANSSVSVINAGPPGPPGVPGAQGDRYTQFVTDSPPTALFVGDQWFNTSNGREYVWYDNFWVEIGTSFQGNGLHVNGSLLTLVAGVPGEITRAALAADADFTSKFTVVVNHGATAATTRVGTAACFWIGSVDPTNAVNNDRLYRTDTTAYYVRVGGAWVESGSSRYVSVSGGVLLTSAATTVATTAAVDVPWDTEVSDPDGWHVAASTTLIVPTGRAGRYAVTYSGKWSSGLTGFAIACSINGTAVYEQSIGTTANFTYSVPVLTFIRTFAAGDTIKFTANQASGSSNNIVSRLEIAPI